MRSSSSLYTPEKFFSAQFSQQSIILHKVSSTASHYSPAQSFLSKVLWLQAAPTRQSNISGKGKISRSGTMANLSMHGGKLGQQSLAHELREINLAPCSIAILDGRRSMSSVITVAQKSTKKSDSAQGCTAFVQVERSAPLVMILRPQRPNYFFLFLSFLNQWDSLFYFILLFLFQSPNYSLLQKTFCFAVLVVQGKWNSYNYGPGSFTIWLHVA